MTERPRGNSANDPRAGENKSLIERQIKKSIKHVFAFYCVILIHSRLNLVLSETNVTDKLIETSLSVCHEYVIFAKRQ